MRIEHQEAWPGKRKNHLELGFGIATVKTNHTHHSGPKATATSIGDLRLSENLWLSHGDGDNVKVKRTTNIYWSAYQTEILKDTALKGKSYFTSKKLRVDGFYWAGMFPHIHHFHFFSRIRKMFAHVCIKIDKLWKLQQRDTNMATWKTVCSNRVF